MSRASSSETPIFLNYLIPKLPAPPEEDLSRGILQTIDMDSYRAGKRAELQDICGQIAHPGNETGDVPFIRR